MLSAHDDEAYALALLGKGQSGLAYLLKDRIAQGDELARAIREVARRRQRRRPHDRRAALRPRRRPTRSDREILDMMAQGLGYAEMAAALGTTQEAVDRRVTELFRRMAADGGRRRARVDELKRLHAAVVEQTGTARSLRVVRPVAGRRRTSRRHRRR